MAKNPSHLLGLPGRAGGWCRGVCPLRLLALPNQGAAPRLLPRQHLPLLGPCTRTWLGVPPHHARTHPCPPTGCEPTTNNRAQSAAWVHPLWHPPKLGLGLQPAVARPPLSATSRQARDTSGPSAHSCLGLSCLPQRPQSLEGASHAPTMCPLCPTSRWSQAAFH